MLCLFMCALLVRGFDFSPILQSESTKVDLEKLFRKMTSVPTGWKPFTGSPDIPFCWGPTHVCLACLLKQQCN